MISFDGKKVGWTAWKEKFLAKAKKKGYKDILLGKVEVLPENSPTLANDPDRQEKLKIIKLNEEAYADLILSIDCSKSQGRVIFNLIKNSKNEEYPDGNARESWKNLERKFNPTTSTSKTKLHKEFYKAQLRKGADPINFITYMEDLRTRLKDAGEDMSETHFVTQILNGLTAGYDNEVRMIEREIDLGGTVTIEDMKERLSLVFERRNDRQYNDDDDENEANDSDDKAFAAGQFKGKCHNCGKIGHKSADCPDKQGSNGGNNGGGGNNGKRFNGRCNWCGIYGHREDDCRKKKAGVPKATGAGGDRANLSTGDLAFSHMDETMRGMDGMCFGYCNQCGEHHDLCKPCRETHRFIIEDIPQLDRDFGEPVEVNSDDDISDDDSSADAGHLGSMTVNSFDLHRAWNSNRVPDFMYNDFDDDDEDASYVSLSSALNAHYDIDGNYVYVEPHTPDYVMTDDDEGYDEFDEFAAPMVSTAVFEEDDDDDYDKILYGP